MIYHAVIIVFLEITLIYAAPLKLHMQPFNQIAVPSPELLMHPMQLSQQNSLQQQLLALQQTQNLQNLNTLNSPITLNMPQELPVILLPDTMIKTDHKSNEKQSNSEDNSVNDLKHKHEAVDEDSVIIDAEPIAFESKPQKAILLVPSGGKFSIGGIISAIPFLPIEINVPDSIAWIYNGISGIISGIGQRFPFRPRPPQDAMEPQSLKLLVKQLQQQQSSNMNKMPVFVVPMNIPMIPMQF